MNQRIPSTPVLYLRAIVLWFCYSVVTTVIGLLVVIVRIISYDLSLRVGKVWGATSVWLLKHICKIDHKIEGLEHITAEQNAIVFCKHQSSWETGFLHTIIPYGRWVFKRELLMIPIFGWALAATNPISINRGAGRSAVNQLVTKGIERLEKGKWIIMFPEGTRTPPGPSEKYKIGGAILAEKSGYPILPIAHNAGEFWPRGSLLKWPGTIKVVVGPLIQSKGKTAKQILNEAQSWIENKMTEISDPSTWDRHPKKSKAKD